MVIDVCVHAAFIVFAIVIVVAVVVVLCEYLNSLFVHYIT